MSRYRRFDLLTDVRSAHNYLTRMVDPARRSLPYWLIGIHQNPAWAKHCRVDDAELVASWYEALACSLEVLGTRDGQNVLEDFKHHLLRSWGEHGLRFHEKYPWTHTMHSSFHEMGYVLGGLVRLRTYEPDNQQAIARMQGLIRGMRSLVYARTNRCFWSGDMPMDVQPIYEFPNDIYIQGQGWDFSKVTGRGETAIRNGVILHPLAQCLQFWGMEEAGDLAVGTANFLLGISRYFNYRGEYFGHVHSSVWVAAGLVLLGRLLGEERYIRKGREIYEYTRSLSGSFGWVPEYAQWYPMNEVFCETCCIRDMILCGFELIDAGFDEYWELINLYTRNQLSEQQFKTGDFIAVDNTRPDDTTQTWQHIDQRVIGGYTGGSEVNAISMRRFRSVAGCCVGTAPQALHQVWSRIVQESDAGIHINLPIDVARPAAVVTTDYPERGWMQVRMKKSADLSIRLHQFQKPGLRVLVNTRPVEGAVVDGFVKLRALQQGDAVELQHELSQHATRENVRGGTYTVTWRGADVIDITPRDSDPLQFHLYQRQADQPLILPPKPEPTSPSASQGFVVKPSEQK